MSFLNTVEWSKWRLKSILSLQKYNYVIVLTFLDRLQLQDDAWYFRVYFSSWYFWYPIDVLATERIRRRMRENMQIRFPDEIMITHVPNVIGLVTGKMYHVKCDLNWDVLHCSISYRITRHGCPIFLPLRETIEETAKWRHLW